MTDSGPLESVSDPTRGGRPRGPYGPTSATGRQPLRRTSVLVADGHWAVRAATLASLRDERCEVIGEASDLAELEERARQLRPDVVVVEPQMSHGNPVDVVRGLVGRGIAVVVHSARGHPAIVEQFGRAGACSYVLKGTGIDRLREAVLAAAIGPRAAVETDAVELGFGAAIGSLPLTRREVDVFMALARGSSNREAGEALGISAKTIETYRSRINAKLGIGTRKELVQVAIDLDLLSRAGAGRRR